MEFLIEVLVDDYDHINKESIAEALDFAVSGAMHTFRDGYGRHAAVINYETRVTIMEEN